MKTKMGFRSKFAYSFFDFATYKDFLVQGFWKSIFYIFLVTLIFSTITSIKTISIFNSDISNIQSKFESSAPKFELKNGLLSIDSNEPIYYKYDGQMFIFDTTGKTNSSVLDTYSDGAYINSNSVIFRQNYSTIQTIDYTHFDELLITNEIAQDILAIFKIIFPVILLVANLIISFFENLVSGFAIIGPLCISIGTLMGVKLSYSKACTLSFYAMTLPLLLESLLEIAGIISTEFVVVFYLVALLYCALAIKEIKKTDKSNLNFMQ